MIRTFLVRSRMDGHLFAKRKKLNEQLNHTEQGSRERYKIGHRLEKVQAALNNLPAVVSKYQITLKTKETLLTFINWACDNTGAKMAPWLPVKGRARVGATIQPTKAARSTGINYRPI